MKKSILYIVCANVSLYQMGKKYVKGIILLKQYKHISKTIVREYNQHSASTDTIIIVGHSFHQFLPF